MILIIILTSANCNAIYKNHIVLNYISPMRLTCLYVFCSEKDRTIDLLEEAYEEGFPSMFSLNVDPNWDTLIEMEGFDSLLGKMNFPSR